MKDQKDQQIEELSELLRVVDSQLHGALNAANSATARTNLLERKLAAVNAELAAAKQANTPETALHVAN